MGALHATIKEILQLSSLHGFVLVAGEKGLDNPVTSAGILDYEFAAVAYSREDVFAGDSFVLSSLLFAKDRPELILQAVRELVRYGVAGLAYKAVVFRDLPQEALDYANAAKFPIFRFEDDVYFENIIYDVMTRVVRDDALLQVEKQIAAMILQDPEPGEVARLSHSMFAVPLAYCAAYFLRAADDAAISFGSVSNNLLRSGYKRDSILLCRYQDSIVLLITLDFDDPKKFDIVARECFRLCRIEPPMVYLSLSGVHPTLTNLHQCLREGYVAGVVNLLEKSPRLHYGDIGNYRFLVPLRNHEQLLQYAGDTLGPIAQNPELFATAVAYVKAQGDTAATALKMQCHRNTVRYRLNKIKALLGPRDSELAFYESLATAVKLYLLAGL